MVVARCCRLLVARAQRDSESPAERGRKVIWIPVLAAVLPLAVGNLIQYYEPPPRVSFFMGTILLATTIIGLAWPLLTRTLPVHAVGMLTLVMVMGLILADINAAARNELHRTWTWVVLLVDMHLAMDIPSRYQIAALFLTSSWLVVSAFESSFGLGLYHIEGFTKFTGEAAALCDCTQPPCAEGWLPITSYLPAGLIILHGDYFATRSFAEGLRQKQARIEASVRVSEQVAELLAAYATGDAQRVVADEGDALPEALRESYEQLLGNLNSYRAYLPDSLLYAARHQQQQQQQGRTACPRSPRLSASPRPAPGLGQDEAHVAICFTDIQSSTELWETYPLGMYESLSIHNAAIRRVYTDYDGYEVKTIGDSFMVAFDQAEDAVGFGLSAQLELLRLRWPEDIHCHPLCRRQTDDGLPLWGGLRVRAAVQSGNARVERNPVTGRCDYYGHTVNTAARLEALVRGGGLVVATNTAVVELGDDGLQRLGNPVVHSLGTCELRGVKESVAVSVLVPQQLRQRIKVLADVSVRSPHSVRRRTSGARSAGRRSQSSCSSGQQRGPNLPSRTFSGFHSPVGYSLRELETPATCAVVRASLRQIEPVQERLPHYVAAACLAADQTNGVVDTVLSACVTVTWNATSPCADHTAACRRFLGSHFNAPCHLGAASGSVVSGSIPAGRRSFATVVGGCLELAAALAEEAERCGDLALVAGAVADDCAAAGAAFCAQLWEAPGYPSVVVWEVVLGDDFDKWQLGEVPQKERVWATGVTGVFCSACAAPQGSAEQDALLKELQDSHTPAAIRLAARIRRGGVRTRPMAPLWDGGGGPVPTRPGDGGSFGAVSTASEPLLAWTDLPSPKPRSTCSLPSQ